MRDFMSILGLIFVVLLILIIILLFLIIFFNYINNRKFGRTNKKIPESMPESVQENIKIENDETNYCDKKTDDLKNNDTKISDENKGSKEFHTKNKILYSE